MISDNKQVAIIDDDRDFSLSLVELLEVEGFSVTAYANANTALKQINADFEGVVLLDIRMSEVSGEEVLQQLLAKDRALPVIHVTGHGDIPMAVRALKQGAYGFFSKPLAIDELLHDIGNALAARSSELARRRLVTRLAIQEGLTATVLGASPEIETVRQQIVKIGKSNVDVLVRGETGAGKELVAQVLVQQSHRADGPFVAVNCGHLSHAQAIEELFGIDTLLGNGEINVRLGQFERANGGTLLLDEIESMPLDMQPRLLRVLQERVLERINGGQAVSLDIRIIATTKVDLVNAIKNGHFREDLYYRLSGVELVVPPVRNRGTDSVLLFSRFLADNGANTDISPSLMSDILSHDWPGNVREIRNAADRYAAGLTVFAQDSAPRKNSLAARVAEFEKGLIESSLMQNDGSVKRTMLDLDVPRKTLYDKMSKYDISKDQFKPND